MKKYWPHLIVSILAIICIIQCQNGKRQATKLIEIDKKLDQSELREQKLLTALETLKLEHSEISKETLLIDERHKDIRSDYIADPVFDSLLRSVYARGKARFD